MGNTNALLTPFLSPDQNRVVLEKRDTDQEDIWIIDLPAVHVHISARIQRACRAHYCPQLDSRHQSVTKQSQVAPSQICVVCSPTRMQVAI